MSYKEDSVRFSYTTYTQERGKMRYVPVTIYLDEESYKRLVEVSVREDETTEELINDVVAARLGARLITNDENPKIVLNHN